MSHPPRVGSVARVAAALVALMLSGAPRVVAMQAPVEGHRCACRAHEGGHRECECAICRKAALSAQAEDATAPPCHRAAARNALSAKRVPGSAGRSLCVEGTCGNGGGAPVTIAGVEPFCVRADAGPTLAPTWDAWPPGPAPLPERSTAPEAPPPRGA